MARRSWGTPGRLNATTRSRKASGLLSARGHVSLSHKKAQEAQVRWKNPLRLLCLFVAQNLQSVPMNASALAKPDLRTEAIAGITTFFTMAYIVEKVVMPA